MKIMRIVGIVAAIIIIVGLISIPIINGWIYYQERNEKNIIEFKRTSEDLSLTEKILESPMSQVRLE